MKNISNENDGDEWPKIDIEVTAEVCFMKWPLNFGVCDFKKSSY